MSDGDMIWSDVQAPRGLGLGADEPPQWNVATAHINGVIKFVEVKTFFYISQDTIILFEDWSNGKGAHQK